MWRRLTTSGALASSRCNDALPRILRMNTPVADVQPPTEMPPAPPRFSPGGAPMAAVAAVGVLSLVALGLVWQTHNRLRDLEQELVRRQASSQSLAQEAKNSATASSEQLRDVAAKLALAEAKLAEVALQRAQLEDLLQSFSRSRDENVVSDLESGLRLAAQQTALVGSAEPLIAALRQADERLQRHKQARLEGVRRAVLRDLDRLKAVGAVDAGTLAMRLDEVARLVDELPLLTEAQRQPAEKAQKPQTSPEEVPNSAWDRWWAGSQRLAGDAWQEMKGLLRVTRIDHPEAVLLAPEQSFLLRENLKLRLLNARLALMSRQFDTARLDLSATVTALQRYADTRQRRTQVALELLRQVQAEAKPVAWPRPDDSLAALAAAGGVVR